jgi:uncharacterized protein YndB with AHSA1/START domain
MTDVDQDIANAADIALVVRRTIRAPVARVFEAWTQPEHLRKWWGPKGVTCVDPEVDLRVGGRLRLGNKLPDGNVMWIVGEFEAVVPPSRLVYSWQLGPEKDPPLAPANARERVTVRFEPRDIGTEVIIVHERLADMAAREGHEAGWFGCLDGLAELLEP